MALLIPSWRSGLRRTLWCCGLGVLAASLDPVARGATPAAAEYQVKAVFLFNFTHFVTWPPEAFADATAPIVIGILGDDPFGSFLDRTVRDEKVNARKLVVRRYRLVEQVDDCHVLYVGPSESGRLAAILEQLHDRSILTVSDNENFARHGGMIALVAEKGHVRLSINTEAARAAHLQLSSNLLRSAELISAPKD
jgi:uncharacterized protein DUF4154